MSDQLGARAMTPDDLRDRIAIEVYPMYLQTLMPYKAAEMAVEAADALVKELRKEQP